MKRFYIAVFFVAICVLGLVSEEAFAIGSWVSGRVTRAPWQEQRRQYLSINEVKYTIMQGTKTVYLYQVNGATNKAPMEISSLQKGDVLNVMAEGNRIYQIEKTR